MSESLLKIRQNIGIKLIIGVKIIGKIIGVIIGVRVKIIENLTKRRVTARKAGRPKK